MRRWKNLTDKVKQALAAAEQRATTAEQKLKHGYFGDTYESLLASWREQDQALQDIYGACGTEENVGCPGDVARIAIAALTSSEGLRHQLEQDLKLLRQERDELLTAMGVAPSPAREQWTHEGIVALAAAHLEDSLSIDRSEGLCERLQPAIEHHKDVLVTIRELLVGVQHQLGYVPSQGGYSTRMTQGEHDVAQAITSIDGIVAQIADLLAAIPVIDRK